MLLWLIKQSFNVMVSMLILGVLVVGYRLATTYLNGFGDLLEQKMQQKVLQKEIEHITKEA